MSTIEHMLVAVSEEMIKIERDRNAIYLTIRPKRGAYMRILLSIDEATELRDMLTRALENAEDVRVVES